MKNIKWIMKQSLASLALLSLSTTASAELIIITHNDTKTVSISKNIIADMYLDKIKTHRDGIRVKTVDQAPGSDAKKEFYQAIMSKTETQVNRYWAKRRYSGKGKPPIVISGDDAVKSWVANNPGAIGYINKKSMDSSVKALLTIP